MSPDTPPLELLQFPETMHLHIDPFSGVAGDMLLAALIDAGASLEDIKNQLHTIKEIEGEWNITTETKLKSRGLIAANYVNVDSKFGNKPTGILYSPVSLNLENRWVPHSLQKPREAQEEDLYIFTLSSPSSFT